MFKLLIITVVFVGIALLALALRVLIKRGGRFPDTHISHNKEMRNRGIHCYQTQEKLERKGTPAKLAGVSNDIGCGSGCACDDNICH